MKKILKVSPEELRRRIAAAKSLESPASQSQRREAVRLLDTLLPPGAAVANERQRSKLSARRKPGGRLAQ